MFQTFFLLLPVITFIRVRKIKKISKQKDALRKAQELTLNANDDEEKVKLIFESVQKEIKNWQADRDFAEQDRKSLPMNDPPIKLFKTKIGHGEEIDDLFAGLVKSLGFDVRLGLSSDRREYLYDGSNYNLLQNMRVVGFYVKLKSKWRFFSPGNPIMKFGERYWYFTGNTQILIDERLWISHKVPALTSGKNKIRRKAKFTIKENGNLEGRIKLDFIDYQAFGKRLENKDIDAEIIKNKLLSQFQSSFANVEIQNVKIEKDQVAKDMYSISFDIKITGYAVATGNRLFFQPAFFQYKNTPLFPHSNRIHPIYIENAWSEEDEITYSLPNGFVNEELISADIKDIGNISQLKVSTSVDKENNSLKYSRNFVFGQNSKTFFSKDSYDEIKRPFETFEKIDFLLISLKK